MWALVLAGLLCATALPAQNGDDQKRMLSELKTLRKVPDDQRGEVTRKLAADIRALPSGTRLGLALSLAGLATEGDYGIKTLEEVASTLAAALTDPGADEKRAQAAYLTLAQYSRYEGVPISLTAPGYRAAMARLDTLDRQRAAADFTLTDLSGKQWRLHDLQGKVVLVNFWATWCPPCRKEMPDLQALYEKHGKQGLVILALSDEEQNKVRDYIAAQHYSFPVLLDTGGATAKAFSVDGIPKSFVFTRDGKLAAQAIDMRTRSQFEAMLAKAGLE